jgi:hypothetical protein
MRIKVIAVCLDCGAMIEMGPSEVPGSVSPEISVDIPSHECEEQNAAESEGAYKGRKQFAEQLRKEVGARQWPFEGF